MNKFRKEKYINQRYSEVSKTWSFQVRIKENDICKTFKEVDYGSPRAAYQNAINYRNQALLDIQKGVLFSKGNIMVEDVYNEIFDLFPMREETKRKYDCIYNKYMQDNMLISNVTRQYILSQLNSMVANCSDDTIGRALSIWKRIFKVAIIKQYVNTDCTTSITAPKSQIIKENKREVLVTREKLDSIEKAIEEKYNPKERKQVIMALEVMWYCGLRPCECFALNKSDIVDGYIDINKELGSSLVGKGEISRQPIIRKCKTEASVRKVPIPTKLNTLLKSYKVSGEKLFPNKDGNYFVINQVGCWFNHQKLEFNMYQLRHTVATRLVTNGVDQRTIIEILGHENFDMSIYYARSNKDLKKNALEIE